MLACWDVAGARGTVALPVGQTAHPCLLLSYPPLHCNRHGGRHLKAVPTWSSIQDAATTASTTTTSNRNSH